MCGIDVDKTKLTIKRLRTEREFRICDLEQHLGLSFQALYRWEQLSNSTLPTLDNLVALADLYGIRIDDIIIRRKSLSESTIV